mmetsp:Transcript_104962/g.203160  ORF Transcript_104962/g.203160 Transcript_104962/m.203160 type:complete len:480 (+) Transcript_104962:60-1499(+)
MKRPAIAVGDLDEPLATRKTYSGSGSLSGATTGGAPACDAVKRVLLCILHEWAACGNEHAEACAVLIKAALERPSAGPWSNPDGIACAPPADLREELQADVAAATQSGSSGFTDMLRALSEGMDVFAWKEPKHLVSSDLRAVHSPPQDLDALLGGPGRFKSAMMVGLERYGASFISDELLVGLTWLAPGTFYPQHAHEAREVYQMIAGTGSWGPTKLHLEAYPPGRFLVIPSATPHTIQAPAAKSLLAVYAWTGQVKGKFWFCDCTPGDRYVADINKITAPEEYYDSMAKDYEAVVRGWGYCMPEAAVDALEAHGGLEKSIRVLDLGCGDGLVGATLRARGYLGVTGADISAGMLARAETRGCYQKLHKADLLQPLPFSDGSFDAVLCVGTTTYLQPFVLRDWLRVLRPGGALVFSHKTAVWATWEPQQIALVTCGAMALSWISEPLHYLPSLKDEAKADPGERAKVYVYRKGCWECFT